MTAAPVPTFLVAGAARSGTTAVIEHLRRHPDVFVTDPKEPHFLAYGEGPLDFRGPGDDATVNRLAVTDPASYLALFHGSDGAAARGEGSVSTLYRAEQAVGRIERYAPGAHVIVILREPAERAFSAFQYLRARGFEPLDDFHRALDEEPRRIADRWQHLWHYVGMGRYGAQLAVLADALGPERLSVFFHDDLVADPDGVLDEMHRRIGVAPIRSRLDDGPVNASGEPRNALVQAIVRFPTRHPRLRAVGRRLVPYAAWQRLRSANLAESSMPASGATRVRAELGDDVTRLREVLAGLGPAVHGDLPAWLGPTHPVTRILALSFRYPPHYDGGYELSTRSVLEQLATRGHDVEVLVSDLRSPGVEDPPGERTANPAVRRDLRPYFGDNALHRPGPWECWRMERHNHAVLRDAIDRFRPDVVGPWQMSALSLGLLTAVAEAGLPMVYMISDDWLSYGPELDAWSHLFVGRPRLGRVLRPVLGVPTVLPDLGATGRFLFISQLQWDRALRYGAWTYPDAEVVHAGFDTDRYPIAERPVDKPWEGRLLYAGRLDPRKGIECVIHALPLLPDAVLEVQGTGDTAYLRTLEELAAGLGVAERLELVADRRGGLRERYDAADVVVFPSEWEEPFGLVPLEAMARGVPVVATGVGGSGEFLVDGENCLLHDPADHEGLAAAVSRLRDDPALRHALAVGGLRTAPRFTDVRIADDLERHYVELGQPGRR